MSFLNKSTKHIFAKKTQLNFYLKNLLFEFGSRISFIDVPSKSRSHLACWRCLSYFFNFENLTYRKSLIFFYFKDKNDKLKLKNAINRIKNQLEAAKEKSINHIQKISILNEEIKTKIQSLEIAQKYNNNLEASIKTIQKENYDNFEKQEESKNII